MAVRPGVTWVLALALSASSLALAQQGPEELTLLREVGCAELFGPGVYEASGVVLANDRLQLVFDNTARIGGVDLTLAPASATLTDDASHDGFSDYEAITFDAQTQSFFVAIEGQEEGRDSWRPHILRYDAALQRTHRWRIDHPLPSSNKGVEGLAFLRRDGRAYLLALLEGNHGGSSDRGRDPGNGRVLVLGWDDPRQDWEQITTLDLPPQAAFVDYAGIDVEAGRVAVVSQTSSQLWVGRLSDHDWTVDEGEVYALPRQASGELQYGRIEGVTWLAADQLAMVSDQDRPRDRGKGRVEQAIHVFQLPAAQSDGIADLIPR